MALCERCRCELLALDFPFEINVATHEIRLLDGSIRQLHNKSFEVIGILWPRRSGYTRAANLRPLLQRGAERVDNTLRMAILNTRRDLEGSPYEIICKPKIGYRIV